MDIIKHAGKTVAGDLQLTVSKHGFYFALGRLDGGFNVRRSDWHVKLSRQFFNNRVVLGPFDLMWTKGQM
jgi:hypothetical protein